MDQTAGTGPLPTAKPDGQHGTPTYALIDDSRDELRKPSKEPPASTPEVAGDDDKAVTANTTAPQAEKQLTLSESLNSHSHPISLEEMQQLGLAHSLMEVAYPDETIIYYFMMPDQDGYILQPVEYGSTNDQFTLPNPEHPITKKQEDIQMSVRNSSDGKRKFINMERVHAKRGITIFRSAPEAEMPASVRLIQFRDHKQMHDVIRSTRVRGEYVNGSYIND
jgi:hypothetical protein